MNRKKVLISVIIIIIEIIGSMIVINKLFQNRELISNNEVQNNQKSNSSKADNNKPYNYQVQNSLELEKMKDSELSDLFYNISKESEFVNENVKNCKFPYNSADSVEDALEKTKTIGQSSDTKTLELKLQNETKYYYVIYQEYISYRETGNVTIKNSYLYFKNSVIDISKQTINTNILNNCDKIKEIFNLYTYITNEENKSIKLLLPEITENLEEYIYTYYYFNTIYGDFGLSDSIELYKSTTTIDKQNGEYKSTKNIIRQVSGKEN